MLLFTRLACFVMYGYVTSYSDNHAFDASAIAENEVITVTNTLPVIRILADKLWDDNGNQDGKRPAQLDFTLTGTAEGSTDITKTCSDTSAAYQTDRDSTRWSVDFGLQPQYNVNNAAYVYSVAEAAHSGDTLAQRGYARYVTEGGVNTDKSAFEIQDGAASGESNYGTVTPGTDASGNAEKTFRFQNRYTPEDDSLKVRKVWNDTVNGVDVSAWTRPTAVEVRLQYSYHGGEKVDLESAAETDLVKAAILRENSDYAFTRTIYAGDSWEKVFEDLPLNVNPTGTAVYNGTSYAVTYSVVETPLIGYTTDDSDETDLNGTAGVDELTVTNTLKTKTVKVQKQWVDNYTGDQVQHYDVHLTLANTNTGVSYSEDKTIAQSGSASATVTTSEAVDFLVPEYIASGAPATYVVTEAASDQKYGYATSYSDNHAFDASSIAENEVMTVTGGSFASEVDAVQMVGDEIRFSISGGAFSSAVPGDFCAAGYAPVQNPDGTYGVTQS